MYSRNRIYISDDQQEKLRQIRILVAGAGLGSVISECLLRLGIMNFTIIDFDKVELSNLNRQNYTHTDIGKYKVDTLYDRLHAINPEAKIKVHSICLETNNLADYLCDFDIAINTLDFNSEVPFQFDNYCIELDKPVIHPYNLGWASCVFVIDKGSQSIRDILTGRNKPEVEIVEFVLKKQQDLHELNWLKQALSIYLNEGEKLSPPQLAVASWITAGMCSRIAFEIVVGNKVETLPFLFFNTI